MVTNGNHNGKGGRPLISIDWKLFDSLCAAQCTLREIADSFNCSEDTIERKVKDHFNCGFSEIFKRKRQRGLISLRANLFKMSEKQPSVAIFLAKNWLGMVDKHEVTGEDGGPVQHAITISVVSEGAKKLTKRILEGEKTE